MTAQTPLFDPTAFDHARHRATPKGMFLHQLVAEEFQLRCQEVNRSFTSIAVVTPFGDFWSTEMPDAVIIPQTDVLQFPDLDYDLILHAMGLHRCEDPLGQIIQCRHALKPDGLFLSAALGGQTLAALRTAFQQAEAELLGGIRPHVHPMAEIRDMGALLQRAGLALPVADAVAQTVRYRDLFALGRDIRDMGETNALATRNRSFTKRSVFDRAAHLLSKGHDHAEVTFEIIFLSGWSPHDSQQKPLRPGSATTSLAQALGQKGTGG